MSPNPEDVFTPATPVQEDMFAARRHADLEDRVNLALAQLGRQVVLYGDTGVGKTSLVWHLARTRKFRMERVECGSTFDDLMAEAVSLVEPRRETGRSDSEATHVEAGVGLPGGIAKGGAKTDRGTTTETRPIGRSAAAEMIDALERHHVDVLFLDNFENVNTASHRYQTAHSIAQLLKSLADRAADGKQHLKVVVAGIPEASESLVALDDATARRTAQIEVPRMPDIELDQILARGEKKLGISFGGLARHMILAYSDGFPYYTHLLALHSSRRSLSDGRRQVDLADFDAALDEILADCDLQIRTSYMRAVETTGEVRIRKSILEAIALYNEVEVTFKAIREGFLQLHPSYQTTARLNFLSTAIHPLKDQYGVLNDRGLPKSKRNLYRFTNPLMRAYVRLRARQEQGAARGFWDPSANTFTTDTPTTTS